MRLMLKFMRSRRGAIAPIMAVCIFVLVLISGGAVEYSAYVSARDTLQHTVDAAALSGARSFHRTRDDAATAALVRDIIQGGEVNGFKINEPIEVSFSYHAEDHSSRARISVTATAPTVFMRMVGLDTLTIPLGSQAIKGGAKDVYLYLLLDVTGSMETLISIVSAAMLDFESQIRLRLEQNGIDMGRLFVKVGFFRDLRVDRNNAWSETGMFDMSTPAQRDMLSAAIRAQVATGGGDAPESSPAAIAYALTAPLEAPVGGAAPPSAHMLQVIALWTHVEGLPLSEDDVTDYLAMGGNSELDPEVDDITVSLYKAAVAQRGWFQSMIGGGIAALQDGLTNEDRTEDKHYNSPDYGCCRSMAELRREWHLRGTLPLKDRHLALFVNPSQYPWRQMANWENVVAMRYVDTSPDAFIQNIVNAVVNSGVNLKIEPIDPTRRR